MRYIKDNKKKNVLIPIICAACAVLLLCIGVLIGLLLSSAKPNNEAMTKQNQKIEAVENENALIGEEMVEAPESQEELETPVTQEDTVQSMPNVDDGNFGIDTPYCELRYPTKWVDYVDVRIQESEKTYTVAFYGRAGGNDYHLFDVYFGKNTGYVIGDIAFNNSVVTVSVEAFDIPSDAKVTDEEALELMMMCEDMNVVISNLMKEVGFTAR